MRSAVPLSAAVLLAGACVGDLAVRTCETRADCLQAGHEGECEPTPAGGRACVFDSPRCPGGEWGVLSGPELAGRCREGGPVPVDAAIDSPPLVPGDLTVPDEVGFGTMPLHAPAVVREVAVTNAGAAATGELRVTVEGPFFLVSDGCGGTRLAAGASCMVMLVFAPETAGTIGGALAVQAEPGGGARAALTATVLGRALLVPNVSELDFGSLLAVTSGPPRSVQLLNVAATSVGPIVSRLEKGTDFEISSPCAGELIGLGSCLAEVVCRPTSPGPKVDALIVEDGAGGAAVVTLRCVGLAPASFSLTPAEAHLGEATVGTTGAEATFTLTNVGDVTSDAPRLTLSNGSFTIVRDCTAPLAPRAGCLVTVAFTPDAVPGTRTATLSAGAGVTAALTGEARASGALTLSPPSPFGAVALG
jgi:hypothetical protein